MLKIRQFFIVMSFIISLTIVPTKNSSAALGLIGTVSGNTSVGLPLLLGGAGLLGVANISSSKGVSLSSFLLGAIMLDDNGGSSYEFNKIDNKAAEQFKLTDLEKIEWNESLAEISLIIEELDAKMVEGNYEDRYEKWEEIKESGLLSPDAASALEKINSFQIKELQK